jgi:hypothetical protein
MTTTKAADLRPGTVTPIGTVESVTPGPCTVDVPHLGPITADAGQVVVVWAPLPDDVELAAGQTASLRRLAGREVEVADEMRTELRRLADDPTHPSTDADYRRAVADLPVKPRKVVDRAPRRSVSVFEVDDEIGAEPTVYDVDGRDD